MRGRESSRKTRGVYKADILVWICLGSTERCGIDGLSCVWSLQTPPPPLVVSLAHRGVGRVTATGRCPYPNPQNL